MPRGGRGIPPPLHLSAPWPLTEMGQYSMERYGHEDSKKYRLISVGHLWAEKFPIEIVTAQPNLNLNLIT